MAHTEASSVVTNVRNVRGLGGGDFWSDGGLISQCDVGECGSLCGAQTCAEGDCSSGRGHSSGCVRNAAHAHARPIAVCAWRGGWGCDVWRREVTHTLVVCLFDSLCGNLVCLCVACEGRGQM